VVLYSLHFNIIFFSFLISNIKERWCGEVLQLPVKEVSKD